LDRKLVRRSFLARVAGVALLTMPGAAGASRSPPRRGYCYDSDRGANSDPANGWYGDRDAGPDSDPLERPPSDLTDGDVGPNSDHMPLSVIGTCPGKRRPGRRARSGRGN
jgi:hypothetical protein